MILYVSHGKAASPLNMLAVHLPRLRVMSAESWPCFRCVHWPLIGSTSDQTSPPTTNLCASPFLRESIVKTKREARGKTVKTVWQNLLRQFSSDVLLSAGCDKCAPCGCVCVCWAFVVTCAHTHTRDRQDTQPHTHKKSATHASLQQRQIPGLCCASQATQLLPAPFISSLPPSPPPCPHPTLQWETQLDPGK